MWWILVWAVLVVGAVAVIGALAWRLVKQALSLGRALADAATSAGDALTPTPDAGAGAPASSVFLDPEAPGGDGPTVTGRSLRVRRRRA